MQINLQNDNIISYKIKHSIESFAKLEIEFISDQDDDQEIMLYDNNKIIFIGSIVLKEYLSHSIKYHFESYPKEAIEKYMSEQIIYKNNIKYFKHMIYTNKLCDICNIFFSPTDRPIVIHSSNIIKFNHNTRTECHLPSIKLNIIYKTFEIYREKSPCEIHHLTEEDQDILGSDITDKMFANIHDHMNISASRVEIDLDNKAIIKLFDVEIDHKIQTINYDQYIIGNSDEYDTININAVIYENIEEYNNQIYPDHTQFKDQDYCYVQMSGNKKKIPFIKIGKTFDATEYGKSYIEYYKQKILYEHYYHQYKEYIYITLKKIDIDIEIYKRILFKYQNKKYIGYIAQYNITAQYIELQINIIDDIYKDDYFKMSFDDANRSEFTIDSYKVQNIQEHITRKCRLTKDSRGVCTIYFTKAKNSDIFLTWEKKFIIDI